jgi:hypothetical protein
VRRALPEYLVVFFPEQHLTLDGLERITDLLGGRDVTRVRDSPSDRPYVIRVIKEPDDQLNFANACHSDLRSLARPPSDTQFRTSVKGTAPKGVRRSRPATGP